MFMVALIIFSAVCCGLNAGLFFIFSNTVMSALGRLEPEEGVKAMQFINRIIQNPSFFFVFFGPAVTSLVLIILYFSSRIDNPAGTYTLMGCVFYLLGCTGVTIACNVPRNEALDKVDPVTEKARELWMLYLKEWTLWNHVRTVACVLAAISFSLAVYYL